MAFPVEDVPSTHPLVPTHGTVSEAFPGRPQGATAHRLRRAGVGGGARCGRAGVGAGGSGEPGRSGTAILSDWLVVNYWLVVTGT